MNVRPMFATCFAMAAVIGCQPAAQQSDTTQQDEETLRTIVAAVASGWENADATPFETYFLDFPGARYVESGGQNEGLRDLVDHHVVPEGDFLDSLTLDLSNIETHLEGDFAWAIADVELKAIVKSDASRLHKRGYETFLFRRIDGQWKVVHSHSSTRAVKK